MIAVQRRWSRLRVQGVCCSKEQRRKRGGFVSGREQKVQSARGTPPWICVGAVTQKVQETNVIRVGERSDKLGCFSTTMFLVERALNARTLTPVSSDKTVEKHSPQTTSCLATKTFVYYTFHSQKKFKCSQTLTTNTSLF